MWAYASAYVKEHRADELMKTWASISSIRPVTEHRFLREYTWAVYVSGFSAKVVSKLIDRLLQAHNIEDAHGNSICITTANLLTPEMIKARVHPINKNRAKANAVQAIRAKIHTLGWACFSGLYIRNGPDPQILQQLVFMGPALSRHLARNLGNLSVAKPDIHLVRLAVRHDLPTVEGLCKACAPDESVGFVDLVLWLAAIDCGTR